MKTRRDFLKTTTLAASALSPLFNSGSSLIAAAAKPEGQRTFAVFTKHFLGLSHEQLADSLAEIGVTAIEAPVRAGGHVLPEKVEDELPKFAEILKKRGIEIAVLTSGINAVDPKQYSEKVLRTAKSLGIPRYRMNWYNYDLNQPVWPQLDEIKPKLKDIVALSKEIGILPCYQNHSGSKMVGAPIWDMAMLMRDYPVTELAWAFDIMHSTIEGSTSWPIEVSLMRDHLGIAYFKNFMWDGKSHKPASLGEGVVGKEYVDALKKTDYTGPVSLHIEYLKGGPKDEGYLKEAMAVTKRDMEVLKSWWA